MSLVVNVNGKPAIRVKASLIKKWDPASLISFEGDMKWVHNACFRDNKNGTVDIVEEIYNIKFPKG